MPTEKTKLTKTFVESLTLSPNKQVFYRDSELIGFALRVTSSKVYVAERRIGNGKSSVRVTIGKHGDITVQQARAQACILLAQMAQGVNPNAQKKQAKTKSTTQYSIKNQSSTLLNVYNIYQNERSLKPKTLKDYQQCVDDYFVDWKNIPLKSITTTMIQDRHTQLSERSQARANLAMRFLSAIFNFAREYDFNINNPVKILSTNKSWNKIKNKKACITQEQLHQWVDTVLSTSWTGQSYYNQNGYTNQDFLLIILLTGLSREETESLTWTHIDFKNKMIQYPNPKNGEPMRLPMGEMLHYILKERFARSCGTAYVFQVRQGQGHITNRSKAREKIAKISGIPLTYHDLKRTFAHLAYGLNMSSYTSKKLVQHHLDDSDWTNRDVQVSFDVLQSAMNKIENVILSDDAKEKIRNRHYKIPTRHQDYLEKSISTQLQENPTLSALSKIDQLKMVMQKNRIKN